jgi:hypothetical protein
MFDAYHDGELQWLAMILRRVLRVPADPVAEIPTGSGAAS